MAEAPDCPTPGTTPTPGEPGRADGATHHHPGAVHEIVGHPRRTGRFWFDFAAATAAIFISLVSLFVAIRGESTQRELLAANSWPFLNAGISYRGALGSGPSSASITVRNDGVGPAKIDTFELSYDGRPVRDVVDLLRQCCGLSDDPATRRSQLPSGFDDSGIAGHVLRAADSLEVIGIEGPPGDPLIDAFRRARRRMSFRACYCSILDRCWVTDLATLAPAETGACRPAANPFGVAD